MSGKTMIQFPEERPFALYDNRFFLSVGETGASDAIVKGDMNLIAAALVRIMLDHEIIAKMFITAVTEYKNQKEGAT